MKDEEIFHDPPIPYGKTPGTLEEEKKADMNCERELGAYIDHNDLVFGFGRW